MIEGMCRHITVVCIYIALVYWIPYLIQHPKYLIIITAVVVGIIAAGSTLMIIGWVYYYFTERNKNGTTRIYND